MSKKQINDLEGKELLADPRVETLLDRLINHGDRLQEAADAAGLRHNRARRILQDRTVRARFLAEVDGLKIAERARNVHAIIAIRDKADDPAAKSADRKNAMEAVRYLDGEPEGGNIVINGGQNVIAGYVVKLDAAAAAPRLGARADQVEHMLLQHEATDTKPLIEHDVATVRLR